MYVQVYALHMNVHLCVFVLWESVLCVSSCVATKSDNSVCVIHRQGFVPAESVMNFRKQLGCDTFVTEEKGTHTLLIVLFLWVS